MKIKKKFLKKAKREKVLKPCLITKNIMKHEVDGDTIYNCTWNGLKKDLKRRLEEWKIGKLAEIIQTTALLRLVKILRRVLVT